MAKKFQLSIPEPCHEKWEDMKPVEQGRFCGSCQKKVIDFSAMSDRELAMFFKRPSNGSVCGRFMDDQLDRTIDIPKKRIAWVKYFFQFALPAFLVSVRSNAQSLPGTKVMSEIEQATPMSIKPVEFRKSICRSPAYSDSSATSNSNDIVGRVIDEKGSPIPYATLQFGKSGNGTHADEDGYFNLRPGKKDHNDRLIVSSVGFESMEVEVSHQHFSGAALNVTMRSKEALPEVIVTGYTGDTRLGGATGGFVMHSLKYSLVDTIKSWFTTPVSVYPNPVSRGRQFTINISRSKDEMMMVKVFSSDGRAIDSRNLAAKKGANQFILPVGAHWAAGTYFIHISGVDAKQKWTEKLVIQ